MILNINLIFKMSNTIDNDSKKLVRPYKWRDLRDQLTFFEKAVAENDPSFLYNNEELTSLLEVVN